MTQLKVCCIASIAEAELDVCSGVRRNGDLDAHRLGALVQAMCGP